MTDLLFGSNYTTLQADDVLVAFENDSRLVLVEHDELFQTPLVKLASKYGLVTSTCEFTWFSHRIHVTEPLYQPLHES